MTAAAAGPVGVIQGTVMFTDIVGFTEFTALRGDAEALALLAHQESLVMSALPQDSRIVKELGDGLLLWFPEPCAAIEFGLNLQSRIEEESRLEGSMPLWVRMGLHWGQQTQRRDDIVGHDVNVASRIVNHAGPGEILLSEATVNRIGPGTLYEFDELGPVVMKGIPDPIRLFRACRSGGW